MKRIIKKWLGITDISERYVSICESQEIRKLVAECVRDSFAGKSDAFESDWYIGNGGIRNSLQMTIAAQARSTAEDVARDYISGKVDHESFIDDVVSRIKSKQV